MYIVHGNVFNFGFHNNVSCAQVFIVYTRVFPKVAILLQGGEKYRIERACKFIPSVVEFQRVKIIQLVAKNSVCCRISTSNESGRQSVVESQRIKSY